MRKHIILSTIAAVLQFAAVSAQQVDTLTSTPVKSPSFLRLYPFELTVGELRVGAEMGTAPRQALVIDGSYFWKSLGSINGQGWAIKMDYRFYSGNARRRSRFFVGPNMMVKRQGYVDTYNSSSTGYTPVMDYRMVYCINLKTGIDFQLTQGGHTRLEVFTGGGLRYRSDDIVNSILERSKSSGSWLPNLLFGIVLKL
ncbi:hypothetical protein [Spirosoma aerophilum]